MVKTITTILTELLDFPSVRAPYIFQKASAWCRWDILTASVGIHIFGLALPFSVLQIYDQFMPHPSFTTLVLFIIGMTLALIMESILRIARSRILVWLGVQFENDQSIDVWRCIFQTARKIPLYGSENIAHVREFILGNGFLVLADLPFLFLYLCLIYYLAGSLVWIPLIALIGFMVGALFIGLKLRHVLRERYEMDVRREHFLSETFTNHYTLKAMGMETLLLRHFERVLRQSAEIDYKVNFYSYEAKNLGSLFAYLILLSIVGFATNDVIAYKISSGAMAACILLSIRIIRLIQAMMDAWPRYQYYQISKNYLNGLYMQPQESTTTLSLAEDMRGGIQIQKLSFFYPGSVHLLLDQIDLEVLPGQMVALQGYSGTGKSALMRLIAGLLKPMEGQVSIDGRLHEDFALKDLRKNIVYIDHQGILFQGSVLENITLFCGEEVVSQTEYAVQLLDLEAWYDVPVEVLPLSIRQRICLARAIVMQPKILILDEANSALDIQGNKYFHNMLMGLKGTTTVLIVTRDPHVLHMADHVYELVDGRLNAQQHPISLQLAS